MVVQAQGLTKLYHRGSEEIEALKGIDFEVKAGEFLCILGPSGAGKTTMLNLIGCMDLPTAGTLRVAGHQITIDGKVKLKETELDKLRRDNIGFIFAEFFLLPTLTALENVELPLLWSGKRDEGRAKELLEIVGLKHRLYHYPLELSGGEMQRVAIARALVNRPKMLLADEPTGNIDTKTRDTIFELFQELNHTQGLTILLATHDQALARRVKMVLCLDDGRIVGYGI